MRLFHPRFRTLSDYHDGALSEERRRRVASHLVVCPKCRNTVAFFRMIENAARALPPYDPKPEVLQEILARRNRGDLIMLPIKDVVAAAPERERSFAGLAVAAVVVMIALSALATFLGVSELTADRSELRFIPEAPRAGDVVRVEYRPATLLRGEDRLVLRARFRSPGDPTHWDFSVPYVVAAELEPGRNGTYTGEFRLPPDALYATFAVEDVSGERIDHNHYRLWDILVHEPDGRPALEALRLRAEDLSSQGRDRAIDAAQALVTNYGDRPSAWRSWLRIRTTLVDDQRDLDSLIAVARRRFRQLESTYMHSASLTTDELVAMSELARMTNDLEAYERWRRRIFDADPEYREVSNWPVLDVLNAFTAAGQPDFARLEEMWNATAEGPARQMLALGAYTWAVETRDADALVRWLDRYIEYHPWDVTNAGARLAWIPGFEEIGYDILRQGIQKARSASDELRRLTTTRSEFRKLVRQDVFWMMAELGRALVNAGHLAEGIAALDEAVALDWHPGVIDFAAYSRLAAGDTLGAVYHYARVAIDPVTPLANADSLRRLALEVVEPEVWERWTREAQAEFQRRMLQDAVLRPLPGDLLLRDAAGVTRGLREITQGRVTLVAFWSHGIGPSRMELPRLQSLANSLQPGGIGVIAITTDPYTPALAEFLESQGITIPVYFDADESVTNTFSVVLAPEYFILDQAGWVRFELSRKHAYVRPNWNHAVDRLIRQAVSLESAPLLASAGGTERYRDALNERLR